MSILVVILTLVLERMLGGRHQHPGNALWGRWQAGVEKRTVGWSQAWRFCLLLFPVIAGLAGLVYLVQYSLGSLGRMLLDIVVLSACLGPRLLDKDIEAYIDARKRWDDQDMERCFWLLTGQSRPEKLSAEIKTLTDAIFYAAHYRWFAVLFWYALLGPVGAVVYRVISIRACSNQQSDLFSRRVYGVVSWLPVRITAFFLGLIGSLNEVREVMTRVIRHPQGLAEENRQILAHAGAAAIRMEMEAEHDENSLKASSAAINWLQRTRGVVIKTLLLWVTLVALLLMLGL